MSTVFTPVVLRVEIFSEIGMLSLRSRSSSTTSTGNSGCVSSSGQVVTAATMLMSSAALRIHSVSAPRSILWSSTSASRMRLSVVATVLPDLRWCYPACYWSAGLSTRHSISTRRLEFWVESMNRPTLPMASQVAGSTRLRGTPVVVITIGHRDRVSAAASRRCASIGPSVSCDGATARLALVAHEQPDRGEQPVALVRIEQAGEAARVAEGDRLAEHARTR